MHSIPAYIKNINIYMIIHTMDRKADTSRSVCGAPYPAMSHILRGSSCGLATPLAAGAFWDSWHVACEQQQHDQLCDNRFHTSGLAMLMLLPVTAWLFAQTFGACDSAIPRSRSL